MARKPAAEITDARQLAASLTLRELLDGRRPGGRTARGMSYMEVYDAGGPQPAQLSRVLAGAALSEVSLEALAKALKVSVPVVRAAYSKARMAAKGVTA